MKTVTKNILPNPVLKVKPICFVFAFRDVLSSVTKVEGPYLAESR